MRTLARGVAPLLGALAIAVFAAGGSPGDAAAEGLFLARLAAGVLAAISWVAPQVLDGALAAGLVVAGAWVLPAGPPRAASVVAMLAAGLALAVWRRIHSEGVVRGLSIAAVPLAIGLQFLLRSDLLLGAPSPRAAFTLLLLPIVGGASCAWLGRRHGARAAIATGALLCVGPGWNLTTTATLLALAAASSLAAPVGAERDRHLGLPDAARRTLVGVAILAPLAGNWRAGLLVLAAAAALVASQGWSTTAPRALVRALLTVLPALLLLALFLALPAHDGRPGAHLQPMMLLALPLLPAALLAALTGNLRALAAILLAAAGTSALGGSSALAPAVALAALAGFGNGGRERWLVAGQGAWSAALLGLTTVLAAYPWLRPEPLPAALNAFGLDPVAAHWPWLAVPALVLAGGLFLVGSERAAPARLCSVLAALLALAALVGHTGARRLPLVITETVLAGGSAERRFTVPADGASDRHLILDSALLDGAGLAPGAAVADVAVQHVDGRVERFAVRAGRETGDWAARRPDLRAAGLAPAPQAWLSWIAGTAPPVFGQRYRARFDLAQGSPLRAIVVSPTPGMPTTTSVVIYGLEVVQ